MSTAKLQSKVIITAHSKQDHTASYLDQSPSTPSPTPRTARFSSAASATSRHSQGLLAAKPEEQNAIMRAPNGPLTSKSGNAMPVDKPNPYGQRPVMSPLGAAGMKTMNTTPLTPKIAGAIPANVVTPLLRRATRQDTTPNGPQRDERTTTPVGSFLSDNITPRSGSRKSRLDSANPTPTGTPTALKPAEPTLASAGNLVYSGGLGLSQLDDLPSKPTVSFSPTISDIGSAQDRSQQQSQQAGKFFYASDAKTNNSQPPRQRPGPPKQNSFLYANGNAIPSPTNQPGPSPTLSAQEDKGRARFVHANGTPDTTKPPQHSFSRAGSTVSSTPFSGPRLAFQGRPSGSSRPSSPTKPLDNGNTYVARRISTVSPPSAPVSYTSPPLNPAPYTSPPLNPAPYTSPPLLQAPYTSPPLYQNAVPTSGEEGPTPNPFWSRSKSPSVSHLDDSRSGVESTEARNVPLPVKVERTSLSSTEGSEPALADDSSSVSGLRSPVKAGASLEQLNELAANARRERKVLDLEITNSSLAAINRTLEREMRKQSAELRRYRRLSRSGRLSIATAASRSSIGSHLSLSGISEDPNSDVSGEEYDDEDDDDDASELDSVDDGTLSPTALAESDARHRKRDEERLQLDLAKHQQLLVDSQKMNQSIKRCLGWTEELILEGNKALAYKVHVSDVELGGRVLIADDHDDHDDDTETVVSEM
ncbi:hypothetical protein V495_06062 [Pseudogymnoascus sp. VKM F-4514 (FW-929)]|nr:hypothetical protein V495_06062 [Pseudogymnoascus sp. VKM F-4514 (FW-929)]KFY54653.1 hypothetical protein V497_07517 [Pseudogymnoascus sp. VKM F-4516 (FW-969)]